MALLGLPGVLCSLCSCQEQSRGKPSLREAVKIRAALFKTLSWISSPLMSLSNTGSGKADYCSWTLVLYLDIYTPLRGGRGAYGYNRSQQTKSIYSGEICVLLGEDVTGETYHSNDEVKSTYLSIVLCYTLCSHLHNGWSASLKQIPLVQHRLHILQTLMRVM